MAIILEEEKNKANIGNIIIWLVVLIIIFASVYYIFFNRPQLVEVVAPSGFKNVDQLSKITINPNDVVNHLSGGFRQYVAPPAPGNAGRPNPFLPL